MVQAMSAVNAVIAMLAGCVVVIKGLYVTFWIAGAEALEYPKTEVSVLLVGIVVLIYALLNVAAIWKAEFDK